MATISTIVITLSTVTIIALLFFIFAKRGWNCTENGCTYGIGGIFNTYEKCTSTCKSSQSQSQSQSLSQSQSQSRGQERVQSQEPSQERTQERTQEPIQVPIPYYSYLQNPWGGPWHHDYYNRDRYHHRNNDSGGNHNNNQNHIFLNSPTGPNI
jgi:hypothetical protein